MAQLGTFVVAVLTGPTTFRTAGILYERGDLRAGGRKKERYAEMGFTLVKFDQITEPLPEAKPRTHKL